MTATPAAKPEQLVFDLPHRQALELEDFLVSRSNAAAVALVDSWPGWSNASVLVQGPAGSGKSHLANVFRLKSGAARVEARDISDATVAQLETDGALAVENIDQGIAADRTLFHLLNTARERKASLLLTSRAAPGEIEIALPDLRSRLRALPLVSIEAPDEQLLNAVLVKLFSDRQLSVEPHVVSYLALHIERSMDAARRVVEAADRLSLARQRRITRAVAAEAVQTLAGGAEEADATR